ncbi:MAG: hypothetical protein LUF82_03950 [Clostridia bacterium]|nr:hypothetical protein [Clostridia bacterium]
MKKYLILLLSVICACCLFVAFGCDKEEEAHTHTWVASGEYDEDDNEIYVCSECGTVHTHTYAGTYSRDEEYHWYASTCGHDVVKGKAAHNFEDGNVCRDCGYTLTDETTYEIQFSYYQYDTDGNIVSDDYTGSYVEVGVTYTAVLSSSDIEVDVENGETVVAGDVISFTVAKSIFCEYTSGSSPLVYANSEAITADSDGVYTFTVDAEMANSDGDIIIWVSNVETKASTISGSGTQSDPYTINSETDWLYFANFINNKYTYGISYNIAYWQLGTDLDFEGEEIYVVGNGYSYTYSVFMGYFDGANHTMSNFVLTNEVSGSEGTYSSYLGLFGVCSVYEGNAAVITNLTLKDFTMTATASSDGACVAGGIVGYSVGFSIVNCKVEGAEINVVGNTTYSSLIGGIVGYLQSYVFSDSELVCFASVQYGAVENTAITCSGLVYAAGGLVGYTVPYSESAPVYITNSYASGLTVSGGIHTGGIVGHLARYSSVQNCYVEGDVTAASTLSLTNYTSGYEGTALDYRYACAGGIVGYAENDTYLGTSFFVGSTSASAESGATYVKTGALYGDISEAGFEEYNAAACMVIGNLHDNDTYITSSSVTEAAIKAMGWAEEDWLFSDTYPTINQESTTRTFTITVTIAGSGAASGYSYTIEAGSTESNSYVYIPMAYRYILGDTSSAEGILIYERSSDDSNYRTYGYYFDEACTQRVPAGYVPTGAITLYAKYVDCSEIIEKEYYVTGNGATAKIVLYANGIYTYEEGAVYIEGNYEYDGTTITFKNGYFSRLSSTATDDQIAAYYTFYATVTAGGDLEIYDCESIPSDDSGYDYLARFYAATDPLVAVCAENVSFAGTYYVTDSTSDYYGYTYYLGKDYTGTYTTDSGATGAITYTVSNGEVSVKIGSRSYTATLGSDGKIVSFVGSDSIPLTACDGFTGTWVQAGIVGRSYEFDGVGGWTYTDGNGTQSGTYTITDGKAQFTLADGTVVTATITDDGTVSIEESTGSQAVTYYAENSLAGTWYTYANILNRYTLVLGGINSEGWGEAEFEGTTGFRYYAASATTLYIYYSDTLYAQLTYDTATGVLEGLFYDSDTEELDIEYTFYMYDDFYGSWVGSADSALSEVSFSGFGMYSVAKADSNSRAVSGVATVNGTSVTYTVDLTTGAAVFTYGGVEYTLVYNAYTNTITATYAGGTITLTQADDFVNIVFEDEDGTTYSFDGRGDAGYGVVTITEGSTVTTATYTVNGDGSIAVSGSLTATIQLNTDGYTIETSAGSSVLYVQNVYTGSWAVQKQYTLLVIDATRFVLEEDLELSGKYGDEDITLTYNGELLSFTLGTGDDAVTYYITYDSGALILSVTASYSDDNDYAYITAPDALYGTWTNSDGDTFVFDGTTGGSYVTYGNVKYTSGETARSGMYYVSEGKYCIVVGGKTYTYTLSTTETDGAYSNGSGWYLAEEE